MSDFIESFYYGNIEPQALSTELTPKLRKKLNELVKKEEELSAKLPEGERELLSKYTNMFPHLFIFVSVNPQKEGSCIQSMGNPLHFHYALFCIINCASFSNHIDLNLTRIFQFRFNLLRDFSCQ